METNNNKNFSEALEGLATLSSKSPEKQDTGSATKTRVRYSGAARRRYKKQMQAAGLKGAAKPSTEPKPAESSTPRTGEQVSEGAVKRPRQELSTPSPTTSKQPEKRPKVADQRTFSQAVSGVVRVAIVPINYPVVQLRAEETEELREEIEGRILGLTRGTKAPTFKGTSDRDGAVVFNCTDEQSAGWLRSLTAEITLKSGASLRALRVDELPKRHRVVVHVDNPKKPINEIIELIDKQNPGVGNDWVIVKSSEKRDAKSTHFAALVKEETLRALEAISFKPFCGLGQATVKLVGGERREVVPRSDEPGPA